MYRNHCCIHQLLGRAVPRTLCQSELCDALEEELRSLLPLARSEYLDTQCDAARALAGVTAVPAARAAISRSTSEECSGSRAAAPLPCATGDCSGTMLPLLCVAYNAHFI
jgi:hypothetical protein